jgi:hypothetical protein
MDCVLSSSSSHIYFALQVHKMKELSFRVSFSISIGADVIESRRRHHDVKSVNFVLFVLMACLRSLLLFSFLLGLAVADLPCTQVPSSFFDFLSQLFLLDRVRGRAVSPQSAVLWRSAQRFSRRIFLFPLNTAQNLSRVLLLPSSMPFGRSSAHFCFFFWSISLFLSQVYASRTGNPNWYLQAPSGSAALGLQTGPITVNSVCPKGLARDCPLGYDYFTDVNSEGLFMIRWLISTILSGKFVHFSSTRTEYVQEIRSDSRWVLQS